MAAADGGYGPRDGARDVTAPLGATTKSGYDDFPILCNPCLGPNPYVRMEKSVMSGVCKMCVRPMNVFKWQPDRGMSKKKTEICSMCSTSGNLCQTCILDLKFGLPSQLRDAVLNQVGNGGVTGGELSDVNRLYSLQNSQALIENNEDPMFEIDASNERLLNIARETSTQREGTGRYGANIELKRKRIDDNQSNYIDQNNQISNDISYNLQEQKNKILNSFVLTKEVAETSFALSKDNNNNSNININNDKKIKKNSLKGLRKFALPVGVLPPMPEGPIPQWAIAASL